MVSAGTAMAELEDSRASASLRKSVITSIRMKPQLRSAAA